MTVQRTCLRILNASAIVALGIGLVACGGGGPQYVQFANGFDFAVKAEVTSDGGATTTIEIPSKARVGADLDGPVTIDFKTADGTSMAKKKYKITTKDKRKEGCQEYINVLGSAAILEEEIVYGIGSKGGGTLLSGDDFATVCPRWGFETDKPPEAITVKEGTLGMDRKWLHYVGDGDWVAAIESLLAKEAQVGDQARIRAWNLAVAVHKHDPKNARLAALGPKFVAACHKIVDMFTTGPLAGKAKADCLKNAATLFPGS